MVRDPPIGGLENVEEDGTSLSQDGKDIIPLKARFEQGLLPTFLLFTWLGCRVDMPDRFVLGSAGDLALPPSTRRQSAEEIWKITDSVCKPRSTEILLC